MSNATQGLAGTRITSLLDANSFVEIGRSVTARTTDFNMTEKKAPSDGANAAVLSVLERHEEELSRCASRLSEFAVRCRTDCGGFTLTHGDAGGNFFTGGGRNYIFDWDEVMYAPPERDAWVMGCFDWARNLFDSTLKACGIPYSLRPERLAFYCFHMYFHYLGEYLAVHPFRDQSAAVTDYLENGWIRSRIRYAETL